MLDSWQHMATVGIKELTPTWVAGKCKRMDLRSFVIRFDFESYVRFEIQFVLMVRFEIFESSVLSIVIRKETIGGG